MGTFDYQKKIWGGSLIETKISYLGYLKLKYTLEFLANSKGRVLDVGCGGGGFIASVGKYRPDLKLFGSDISRKAIDKASKKFSGINFKIGDIYSLSYKDSYFDAVLVSDVFEHLDNPNQAVLELKRVLKPSGSICTFIPVEGSKFSIHHYLEKFGYKPKLKYAGHVQSFSQSSVTELFESNGFEITQKIHGVHAIGQLVDIAYFTYLYLRKKKPTVGFEEEIKDNNLLQLTKSLVVVIINLESILLQKIPGAGIYIKAVKL